MRAHRRDDEWLRPCLMEDVKSGAGDGREIGDAPAADADGDAVIPAESRQDAGLLPAAFHLGGDVGNDRLWPCLANGNDERVRTLAHVRESELVSARDGTSLAV